jgi:hypothetical protein
MTWTGTLCRADFGPGGWYLELKGGEKVALIGDVPAELVNEHVHITGHKVEAMGFMMVGSTTVAVETVERK